MKYIERMQKILDLVKEQNLPTASQRSNTIVSLLEGEYMIKLANNHPWYTDSTSGTQYLGFLTFFAGIEMTRRCRAARFKKEELPEVIARLHNLKYFKLIKIKK